MAEEGCTLTDWNNDKSDEIFFSLLGELLQNNTRATELYTLLSSQANNKSQFQNDNEYRCKEDAMEDDNEESDLNKLVDILKNRLQNGKSVPAGLTQEKLTRLKDDFLKQKEENKRTEQNHNNTPMKKTKNATPVLVAKPKPKNKKQLQAEQRRRELEMANIAKELEEKKKKKEEKEQFRKNQEKERKRLLEEDLKRQEEDKKRLLNESKKKKEKEEKEKEYRTQKEKERQDRMKKTQEEEQRRKEEEKRRKAEEKTAKQKALKEGKEREEREKLEKQLNQKGQGKVRSQQYQQYQQQQQKYPREVPPRFLRQQQIKQQVLHKDQDFTSGDQYRENSNWTEIVPDASYDCNNTEDWEVDVDETVPNVTEQGRTYSSWGGVPASEDWDLDVNKPSCSSVNPSSETRTYENSIPNELKGSKVGKNAFAPLESSSSGVNVSSSGVNDKPVANSDSCWGASLTGSTWDTGTQKQWENDSVHSDNSLDGGSPSNISKNLQSNANSSWCKYSNKPAGADSNKSDSPGITPWAGLDSFEAAPISQESVNHVQSPVSINNVYSGGAKPKTSNVIGGNYNSFHSDVMSDKIKQSQHTRLKDPDLIMEQTDSAVGVSSIDNKIDTNLKVTGWLESSTPSEDWDEDDKDNNDEDFGWTTVSMKTKKPATGSNPVTSVPSTPSKSENGNAWTNRALKQLLDMGFKREHAEKALRDNNGIIESAVSDLLMKGDMTEPALIPSQQQTSSKTDTNNSPSCNGIPVNQATTPQKLNRKQRRKLQQMQNAEHSKENSCESSKDKLPNVLNSVSDNTHSLNTDLGLKQKGDGLLPTPPPSLRLVPTEEPTPHEKAISRPQSSSKAPSGDVGNSLLKTSACLPQPIGQQSSKLENDQNTGARAPIGSSRPSAPAPIQPPNPQPKSQTNLSSSSSKETIEQMNGTPLQPPVNPVLLAQMHLQKLGLESSPVSSSSYTPSVQPPASSQTVTNSMIQQYLQQIAQSSEVEPTAAVSTSPITTPLHTASSMHLSGLLQQAPVPASSLSEGPQKSKLLQWTQPSSASNSEPTTPPTTTDYVEEPPREKTSPVNKVDPVSAKWGVVAIPRLLPTPAEFKPGVPWKPRGDTNDDNKADEEDDTDDENDSESDTSMPEETPKTPSSQNVTRSSPEIQPIKPVEPPEPAPQQPPPPPPPQPTVMPMKHPEQSTIRPPPGLGSVNSFSGSSVNSFSGMKNKVDEMNWLTVRGWSSAIDPSTLRSLCQQFGTLLDFRIIGNTIYVRYETHAHAHSAHLSLSGKLIYNSQILAEVSTEYECMKAIENSSIMNSPPVATVPLTNHLSQPIAPGFPNISSFGGLWASPGQAAPPSVPQPFVQQSFAPTYAAPSSINMNGGFAHWGLPSATTVIPNTNQLWQAAPQQPTNVFQTYPGWLTAKPAEVPVQASIFSPGMDRCLPSELFNAKEHGS